MKSSAAKRPPHIESIGLEHVNVLPGRRAIDPEKVSKLAESMETIGLHTPITIRIVAAPHPDDGEMTDTDILVAGLHRLEAARQLGWKEIDCIYVTMSDDEARMWEISENLHRADLTILEREEHRAEWIRLDSKRRLKAQVAPLVHDRGRPNQGINAASRDLGINRTEAQRAIKIADMAPEAKEAAIDAGLDDNQSVLLKAAKEPSAEKQLASIKKQAKNAADRKSSREDEDAIARAASSELTQNLLRIIDHSSIPMYISWFEACKLKYVISDLRKSAHDKPPMDRRYG